MSVVVIYVTPFCPYCDRAKALLAKKGITPVVIDISVDAQGRQDMLDRSQGRKTVPQIFIDNYHVGGCDDLYDLNKKGQLDKLLQPAPSTEQDKTIK